jgi:hypothetical protein
MKHTTEDQGVTASRYVSGKLSQSRNDEYSVDPNGCNRCREPFAPGQMRYPIVDTVNFGWGWGLVSVCQQCFDDTDNVTQCSFISLDRLERKCGGLWCAHTDAARSLVRLL